MKRSTMAAGVAVLGLALLVALKAQTVSWAWAAGPQQADRCNERLRIFDTLDYQVFSNQLWNRLSESHGSDIIVTWPDGHETNGIARHIEDLRSMFVYAPNTNIAEHPIRICQGDYTAVTGIMTGTFSRPMPVPNGNPIQPTGRSFRLPMATIAHWRGSTMDHEWLYWDNHEFMRQIGLVQ